MKGLILTNAYYDAEAALYPARRLKEELKALGAAADVRRNDFFPFAVEGGALRSSLEGYGFCVYLDKDKYVLRALGLAGVPVFDKPEAIVTCDDKMLTFFALAGQGVPMPDTLPGLLCYTPSASVREETLRAVEERFGYPVIVKESYGSLGKGVYLSVLPLFVYQGGITLLARFIRPWLTDELISQLSCIGSVLIFAIGFNLMFDKKVKVGNLLPAIFLPVVFFFLARFFPALGTL